MCLIHGEVAVSFITCDASLLDATIPSYCFWVASELVRCSQKEENGDYFRVKAQVKGLPHTRSVAAICKMQQVWFMESCLHYSQYISQGSAPVGLLVQCYYVMFAR